MKKIKLLALIAIVAIFASCNNQGQSESTELAVPVSVEDVKLQSIQQYVTTTGTVNATSEITLISEMAGDYYLQTNPSTAGHLNWAIRCKKVR